MLKETTIDGVTYDLVPKQNLREIRLLLTFNDCFNTISPGYPTNNSIVSSVERAEQMKAATQLSVICDALNGPDFDPAEANARWHISWNVEEKIFSISNAIYIIGHSLYFRNKALAQQALKIAEPLFRQYFGV